jgi:hypothetical protein
MVYCVEMKPLMKLYEYMNPNICVERSVISTCMKKVFSQLGIGSKDIGKILDTLEENKKSIAQK